MKKVMTASKKYLITIICFAVVLVACIGATIGITLAFFGDAKKATANITLASSIEFDGSNGIVMSTGLNNAAVVPSQLVTVTTTLTIKNGAKGTASPAVLQLIPTFSAGSTGITCNFDSSTSFSAKVGSDSTGAKLVVGTTASSGGSTCLYLVKSGSTNLYTFTPTSSGTTITFEIQIPIPNTITNSVGGEACTLNMTAKTVQATYYNGTTTAVTPTTSNYYDVFNAISVS